MKDNTYQLEVICKNCGFQGNVNIKMGNRIEQRTCPDCECPALERIIKPRY